MVHPESPIRLPRRLYTDRGQVRRLGIELEFTGLALETISRIVAQHTHGSVQVVSLYEHYVRYGDYGSYQVELDSSFLKERGRQLADSDSALNQATEELLKFAAEKIVPFEVVTPPIPMNRLSGIEDLIRALRIAGAQGTSEGIVHAFGMQLNPEMPATDENTIVAYLKAFLGLFDWLKKRSNVDFTRRLTPYVDPFPRCYVRKVIDPDYQPGLTKLIDDYLVDNPTRNRALDLLPLLSYLDDKRVKAVVPDPRVKSRPALHYRLPNCEIDRPGWVTGHLPRRAIAQCSTRWEPFSRFTHTPAIHLESAHTVTPQNPADCTREHPVCACGDRANEDQ